MRRIMIIGTEGDESLVIDTNDAAGQPMQVMCKLTDDVNEILQRFIAKDIDEAEFLRRINDVPNPVDTCRREVSERLAQHTRKLTCDGHHVYYLGVRIEDDVLENHLVRCLKEGNDTDVAAWCKFTERLYENADEDIRAELFRWMNAQDWHTLDDQGRIIGYRGCCDINGIPHSQNTGKAFVNEKEYEGHIPNPMGAIVTMNRHAVQKDSATACGTGLHVGTYDYAMFFAANDGFLLRVAVAPEDVVSVPYDTSGQKMRVCKFEVLDIQRKSDLANEFDDEYDDDDEPVYMSWQSMLTYMPQILSDDFDEDEDYDEDEDEEF